MTSDYSNLGRGSRGNIVRELQNALTFAGYYVAADGSLGPVTWDALDRYAQDNDVRWDKNTHTTIGAELARALTNEVLVSEGVAASPSRQFYIPDGYPDIKLYDLRMEQESPIPRSKKVRGRTVMRRPAEITGLTFHQMACTFDVAPYQLKASGGDRELARARRMMNVPAHVCVMMTGGVVVHSPLEAYLNHGHGFNSDTYGIEVEGLYAGVKGVRTTMWKPDDVMELGEKTKRGIQFAIDFLVLNTPEPTKLKYMYAHRQSYDDKRADPGSEIWGVAEKHCAQHSILPRYDHTRRDGLPIPKEWSKGATANYRG